MRFKMPYKTTAGRDDWSEEEVAHKVAWAAVKNKYHKDSSGNWQKNT